MKYLYDAQLNLFYPLSLKECYGDSWPDKGKIVDESIYTEFAANAPPEGKVRAAGGDGMPVWVDIPVQNNPDDQ